MLVDIESVFQAIWESDRPNSIRAGPYILASELDDPKCNPIITRREVSTPNIKRKKWTDANSACTYNTPLYDPHIKDRKERGGPLHHPLGLRERFPSPHNAMTLRVELDPTDAAKWEDVILDISESLTISRATLEVLIGRLNFALPTTFNKLPIGTLKP